MLSKLVSLVETFYQLNAKNFCLLVDEAHVQIFFIDNLNSFFVSLDALVENVKLILP
jgi:hypothetical protein